MQVKHCKLSSRGQGRALRMKELSQFWSLIRPDPTPRNDPGNARVRRAALCKSGPVLCTRRSASAAHGNEPESSRRAGLDTWEREGNTETAPWFWRLGHVRLI